MTQAARKQRRYILTETAERDFREARRWSLSRWGKALTKQYFSDLHGCAENLVQNPWQSVSMEQTVNMQELKICPVREHYLVYLPIRTDCIAIVALIRQSRDVPSILNANGFLIRRQLKEISENPVLDDG